MSHVIYIILFDPAMEYLGPNMTLPGSHVAQKNENHGQKWPQLYSNSILSDSIKIVVLKNHSGIIGSVSAKTKEFVKIRISHVAYDMLHIINNIICHI